MSYEDLVKSFKMQKGISVIPQSPANVIVESIDHADAKQGHMAQLITFTFETDPSKRSYVVYHVDNRDKKIKVGRIYKLDFTGAGTLKNNMARHYTKRVKGADFLSEYSFHDPIISSHKPTP